MSSDSHPFCKEKSTEISIRNDSYSGVCGISSRRFDAVVLSNLTFVDDRPDRWSRIMKIECFGPFHGGEERYPTVSFDTRNAIWIIKLKKNIFGRIPQPGRGFVPKNNARIAVNDGEFFFTGKRPHLLAMNEAKAVNFSYEKLFLALKFCKICNF